MPSSGSFEPLCFDIRPARKRAESEQRNAKSVYKNPIWRTLQRELKKDRVPCERCGVRRATENHHKKPLIEGGAPFDLDNIEKLCAWCHKAAHRRPKPA